MSIDTVREAPGYDHYWEIVLNWSRDMGTIKKLSVHEMHTLTERLQSITAAALSTIDPEAIRAETLKDAAGRAVVYIFGCRNDNSQSLEGLHAAILGAEPEKDDTP